MKDEYTTKDIGEASGIMAFGGKLLRLESESGYFWFVFEGRYTSTIGDKYWSGSLTVDAIEYYNCFKNLKDRVFARKVGGGSHA